MLNKILFATLASFLLSSCGEETKQIIVKKPEIIALEIDDRLLDCELQNVKSLDVSSLTDLQISRLITQFYKDNTNCYEDVKAIEKILDASKEETQSLNMK